jgi:hypothetical protein
VDRDRVLGWLFSGAVAACALFIFWDGLLAHRAARKAFLPPVVHAEPVAVPIVPPMELPPPVPREVAGEPGLPGLTKLLPPAIRPAEAKIMAIQGDIVTFGLGSGRGVKTGNRFAVWRGGARLGVVTVTEVGATFAIGRYAGAAVRMGDGVGAEGER